MAETSGLLNRRRALKLYRGFESLSLRQAGRHGRQRWFWGPTHELAVVSLPMGPIRSIYTFPSGSFAGPFNTAPSGVNRLPWQGQSQVFSAGFQATSHFMWVQTADTQWRVPASSR